MLQDPETQWCTPPRSLDGLLGRVRTGIQPSLDASWVARPSALHALPEDWKQHAQSVPQDTDRPSPAEIETQIAAQAGRWAGDREALLDAVHRPMTWMSPVVTDDRSPLGLHATWALWCWAVEALWEALDHKPTTLISGDVERLRPLVARLRFLVLSEAFRHRGESGSAWLPGPDGGPHAAELTGDVAFLFIFGAGTWHLFVARARQARLEWKAYLDSYQSFPALAQAAPRSLEQEIDALAFRDARPGPPLSIASCPLAQPLLQDDAYQVVDREIDEAVYRDIAERHFLPRFQLSRTVRLAYPGGSPRARPDSWRGTVVMPSRAGTIAACVIAAAVVACVSAGCARFTIAGWASLGCYLLVSVGAVTCGGVFTLPWLLRWPAACTLGLLVLTGLNGDWWLGIKISVTQTTAAAATLIAVALGYLVVEVRNHGASGAQALGRGGGVLLVGLTHSLLISLIGLTTVMPAFVQGGDELASLFDAAQHGPAWRALALATSWCVAAGVISQILWDDRPITAPLAHSTWRSGSPS